MHHSWAFWFNHREEDIREVIFGKVCHNYNPEDRALRVMRWWDFKRRGGFLGFRRWHYYRERIPQRTRYRYPRKLAYYIPTLLRYGHRRRWYRLDDLNFPAGSVSIPFAQENFQATEDLGWDWKKTGGHSDFLIQPFYKVYDWYKKFFGKKRMNIIRGKR